jgi:hypothetical protein
VTEEKELQAFFLYGDVPGELRQYIPLFAYIRDEQSVKPGDGFDERLQNALKANGKGRYVTIRIFRPLLRIAVSALLVMSIGLSVYFISKQDNLAETFDDPDAAMQQAVVALEKLSHALRKSETASVETIRLIDKLDIDWVAIDSMYTINNITTIHR